MRRGCSEQLPQLSLEHLPRTADRDVIDEDDLPDLLVGREPGVGVFLEFLGVRFCTCRELDEGDRHLAPFLEAGLQAHLLELLGCPLAGEHEVLRAGHAAADRVGQVVGVGHHLIVLPARRDDLGGVFGQRRGLDLGEDWQRQGESGERKKQQSRRHR